MQLIIIIMLSKYELSNKKINIIKLPLCSYCYQIIQLLNLSFNNNNLYITYSCGCVQNNKTILFDKFNYQLSLFINFYCKGCICKNNKSICYCLKCNKYLCNNCCIFHINHLLFDCEVQEYQETCKEHQKDKNQICNQCKIAICSICFSTKHKGHSKTSMDEYYKATKNKYYRSITDYIKQITKKYNITNTK